MNSYGQARRRAQPADRPRRIDRYRHARKVKADFAVMNSGGIRESLPEGDFTYRDVLKVQPFEGTKYATLICSSHRLDLTDSY